MRNSKNKTLTKSEMKKILGGNDQSQALCEPPECALPIQYLKCNFISCPPLEPDPD